MERARESRQVGLARALSKLGYCSRSKAAELIRAGRVQLNGATRKNPETPVRLQRDRIEVDGSAVNAKSKIYLMLNKPRGVVTTASDEKGRETVYSCLGEGLPWIGPVGRLDKASEGLLLLTNDSEWASRISDPNTHLDKTYHVQVDVVADEKLAAAIALVCENAFDGIADQRLDVGNDCCKRVAVVRVSGQRLHMGHELSGGGRRATGPIHTTATPQQ